MALKVETPRDGRVWGTFEAVRDHLFHQWDDPPYEPSTGLTASELEHEIRAHIAAHPEQPRVLQKAHAFRIVTTRGRICIDPQDWFADKLDHGGALRSQSAADTLATSNLVRRLSLEWLEESRKGPLAETSAWLERAYRVGQAQGPRAGLDRGHIAPGWDMLMAGGLEGVLVKAAGCRAALGDHATPEQLAFYAAVEIVNHAAIALAGRFSRLATEMIPKHPAQATRLRAIASACANVPARRPRTFHEALQFHWLMHEMYEMEGEFIRSAGQFDRTFYPFYRADIDSGRLTREQAKELIKFFWFKWYARTRGRENGKNFCFGGQYPDGSLIDNDLTYLALEAYEELNTPDPKLSVRFTPETPERLHRRVADMVRHGHNSFVLLNDPPAVEALVKRGKPVEDARFYLPIGCYEPTVEGKEAGCTMNITVNLAKGVELALNDGADPLSGEQVGPRTGDPRKFESFDDLWNAYVAQMDAFLTGASRCIAAAEREWPRINPSPLLAGAIDDCLARGKDIGEGGPAYNSVGFVGAGLANAADSLTALKRAVFDERLYAMDQVLDALRGDFAGQERMRLYLLNRVPKWGCNDPEADAMAKRVADWYCAKVHSFTNGRGGACNAALFTLSFAWEGGALTGALPDGRRAREALAPGMGASSGRDTKGVTALINSVTKLDATSLPNGAVMDVTLHPTAVSGEDGLDAFVALIKTFLKQGGYAVQFNVFDVATLRDAQRHPEKYASLQIRVTGWSVYFTSLSKREQDLFISRVTHGL